MKRLIAALIVTATGCGAYGQPSSVVQSPHNLSTGGPGPVRAATENEVCIFCHTPHNASPVKPLWNRALPTEGYTIYSSRSLDAVPGQPTGTSKLCLSCHDGTIALGSVVSRGTPIMMAGGVTTIPRGPGHIGTDLADDHPISFRYDTSLASKDRKLRQPGSLPHEVKLDQNLELQCTTCHDAHNNSEGNFLVMRNSNSQLCLSCHQVGTTTVAAHTDCSACHQPHTAPSGPYLLKKSTITQTCVACHNGSVPGAANIEAELHRAFVHDTGGEVDPPEPLRDHATCTDCHEAHTMGHGKGTAPRVHANFGQAPGVSISGSPVSAATSEYEVCFRCHADANTQQPAVPRRIVQNNTRLEFGPSAASFHPVAAPGRNMDVPSLRPPLTTASMIYCSDCHASDAGQELGNAPGTHGSNVEWLLTARYETNDFSSESAATYALCYKCHDRANILDNQSFPEHRRHIVDLRAPCAACHDAHGISSAQGNQTNNSNLINFATDVVFPDGATGRLEFRDTGRFSGECFLRCHGKDHSPARYPTALRFGLPPGVAPR